MSEVKTEETKSVKCGDVIAIKPEHYATVRGFLAELRTAAEAVRVAAELSRHTHDAMFRAIRAWHPELEEFQFSVDATDEVMELTVLYPKKWEKPRYDYAAKEGNQMVKELRKELYKKPSSGASFAAMREPVETDEARKDS